MSDTNTVDGASGRDGMGPKEIVVVICALVGWCVLFTAGIVIDSSPYRNALATGATLSALQKLKYWFVVLTTFTLTNVAILCCLISLVGAAGRRLRLGISTDDSDSLGEDPNPYTAAIISGFVIYLVSISGILVLIEQPFTALSPERYVRLAGLISLLSFLVGFRPRMLARFLGRVAQMMEGNTSRPSK